MFKIIFILLQLYQTNKKILKYICVEQKTLFVFKSSKIVNTFMQIYTRNTVQVAWKKNLQVEIILT